MKRLSASMFALLVVLAPVAAAHAQDQGAAAFDNEFSALKERAQASPVAADEEEMPEDFSAAASAQQASPLGPAANLPVGSPIGGGFALPGQPQSPEELQLRIAAEAAEQQRRIEERTFDLALKNLLPLTPPQMRRTLEEFKVSREAAETPITVPEPRQVVQTVSLDPGDPLAVIKMSPSHVTTVTILDSTGAPWPIQDISWAGKFEIIRPEEGGHVLRITPSTAHGIGNASIRLVDLITPITVRLVTGLDEVHYRFDARIPKPGPLAKVPLIEFGGLKAVAGRDDDMVGVLDGTRPQGATRVSVKGADGRTTAWKTADKLYLRTPLTLLSPAWDSSATSADGMNVYSIAQTPVVLLSDRGRMVRAQIVDDEVTP